MKISHTSEKAAAKQKYYVLEMFSYPSASNLHMGHWYNYGPSDSFARFKKMQGYDVFQPMGFDAFGLPAENYAIKTNIHPKDSTEKNIATMEKQLKRMNGMFDWKAEIKTCDPSYYKWTQWLFLQLYKKGLAYQKESPVNWCGSCQTVIANEQVVDGECERCGSAVKKRFMKQWFFKITDYAEELLDGLDGLDWPEKTKAMQKNWIGKSIGGEIEFDVPDKGVLFKVFTTRADTLFGVTYVVLAPEHPLVDKLTAKENAAAVNEYREAAAKQEETERLSAVREKTGVFTGSFAVNPGSGERIPVYIADYVLYTYGTGAVMAVPAHDERDFAFANKYNLPIRYVIKPATKGDSPHDKALSTVKEGITGTVPVTAASAGEACFTDDGVMFNSGVYSGMNSEEGRNAVLAALDRQGKGRAKINYRLRDWSVSRQRFWGAPIPIIYCKEHGAVPVPEKDLPVELPYDVDFKPSGKSPLQSHEGFMNTVCPRCGKPAKRDPDTLDTFVCSSWYFLRYPYSKMKSKPFDYKKINDIMPVDKYIGGAEHACMHLLYARFVTKALRDMGYLKFDEPFKSLVHQGMILGTDGFKMSKNRGNVINPDIYVNEYGADVLRLYLLFGFSYIEGGPWSDDGIKGAAKFLERAGRLVNAQCATHNAQCTMHNAQLKGGNVELNKEDAELRYVLNYTIKAMTADMEVFSFNTAVARLMELVNALYKYDLLPGKNYALMGEAAEKVVKLLAPLAPKTAQRFWKSLGHETKLMDESYPVCDESALIKESVEIAVQINSRLRSRACIPAGISAAEVEKLLLADEKILALLEGKPVKKMVVVPERLVNIIV